MVPVTILATGAIIALASRVSAHATIWVPSMWGFNKSDVNRPQEPLINLPFSQWWFHGHLDYPPHPEDITQLQVGGTQDLEISCDKDATSYWPSGPGGDQRDHNNPNYPCPGQPLSQFHTNGINGLGGCALGVAYKSDVNQVQPEDFTIFSVNQTCVWYLHTSFSIPAQMPKCPNGKCICAWFWIHKADSGSEQMYMTGFQCNMKGAVSTTPLPPAQVPRRCGDDPDLGRPANPANCTYGPKQPFYWYQAERNNMLEGTYTPPLYTDLYHFLDGAQNDIFQPGGGNPSIGNGTTTTGTSSTGTTTPVPSKTPLVGDPSVPPSPPSSSSSSSSSSSPPSVPSPPPPPPPPPSSSSSSSPPSIPSPPPPPPPPSSPKPSGPPAESGSSTPPKPSSPPHESQKPPPPPPPSTHKPPAHKPKPTPTSTPKKSKSKPTCKPRPSSQPAHAPKPKPKPKCSHDPNHHPKSSDVPPNVPYPRADAPAPRQLSSLDDAPVRRVWGHHHRRHGRNAEA